MAKRRGERSAGGGRPLAAVSDAVAGGLAFVWLVGQIARDATLPTALLFYLPSLLVASGFALLAGLRRLGGRPALPVLALALPPLAVGLLVEHRWGPPEPPPAAAAAPLRLVHWNVSGGWEGLDQVAREIAAERPDLVVLSEGPERVARRVAAELPELEARSFGALSVLARGLQDADWVERRRELQMIAVSVPWRGRTLRLLAANLASSPWTPRDPSLTRLRAVIVERRPDLVVGDFNAPRRSRVLARLPAGYRHAYDEAGTGWSASWPVPVPLLSLDHVLCGPRLRAAAYRLRSTPWSDHRLQVAELVWSDAADAAP